MGRYVIVCLLLAFAAVANAAEPAKAAAKPGAPEVKQLLEELEYKYEVDADGDYKLVFDLADSPDKRSQLIYVRSPVETYGAHRVREIWSPGYKSKTADFPVDVANRLLQATQESKLGAWAKQNDYAVFVIKLPADADAEQLDDAIDAAINSADQMEAELTPGKDDF